MVEKNTKKAFTEGLTIKPLEKEIFLFDTIVAGTTYIEGIADIAEDINIGDKLEFLRKSDNSCDEKAIKIMTESGVKIGYVPMKDNVIFDRLIDAGKSLLARVTAKEVKDDWVKLDIKVFLKELS